MRNLIFFAAALMLSPILPAQSVMEGVFPFDKKIAAKAVGLTRPFNEVTAEEMAATIQQRMAAQVTSKPRSMGKNFFSYEAVVFPEISLATLNYYFRVDKLNKKTGMSAINLFISPGYDNFYSSVQFPNEMNAATRFLNTLPMLAQKYALEGQLKTVEQGMSAQEKELGKLQQEIQKLDKTARKQEAALAKTKEKREKLASQALEIQNKIQGRSDEAKQIKQTIRSLEGRN